jgi:hypothetical protein
MPVKPPASKHTSVDQGNKLIILIPSLKNWFWTFYSVFSIIVWAFFEYGVLSILIFNRNEWDKTFIPALVFAALFLTVAGGFVIYNFAWQVAGKEVVEVTIQSIIIRRVALMLGFPKEYSADHIRELRVSSSNMRWYVPGQHNVFGTLAFDYDARTRRFGSGVDEAEARQILAEIQQKYPQYKN